MKFTTLIPLRFNDRSAVPQTQLDRIIDELTLQFGGSSDEGITKGQWLDPKDSRLYRDESRRISVALCNCSRLWESARSRYQ